MDGENLFFDVSSGLKSVIGRDLITNDEVAVFELVKNSFDAGASHVQIHFSSSEISIVDDGVGMSVDDIKNKWLFVAYSSKKESISKDTFRDQIAERKHFAGSKGIGRFSSDRLGGGLTLQSRTAKDESVSRISVNWDDFEKDSRKLFESIPVLFQSTAVFDLPNGIDAPVRGTAITITNPRVLWSRTEILHLKSSLAKLINPFGSTSDGFRISMIAPDEVEGDEQVHDRYIKMGETPPANELVNGEIGNFIFATLREKTTYIDVNVSEDGHEILSSLTDRGELVYRIKEPNPFPLLAGTGYSCQLYYLNQSAKATFARRMGLPSVQFGSVFLFRNGFRVFPVGEEGDDTFGIDRRKQQGYARFLGSRDVIGRIDVSGSEEHFKEASSRNQGLVDSPAVKQLHECFWEFCFKRLERYVVPVTWVDAGEKVAEDLSRLLTDSGKARVASAFAKLIDSNEVEVVTYSKRLIGMLNERSSQFEDSIISLRAIAEKTRDPDLFANLERAEKRFQELKQAETEALRIANEERAAKERAQLEARYAEEVVQKVTEELGEEKKRSLFLASITSLDTEVILNMHHQITIYAGDLRQQLENCLAAARNENGLTREDAEHRLEQATFLVQKILSVSKMATKANFRLESDTIESDLVGFIESYVAEAALPFLSRIGVTVETNGAALIKKFRPMEMAVVLDNLINNAKKAGANEVKIEIASIDKKNLRIVVKDNGRGIDPSIVDHDRLFELGFSRTSGSGLGLYHVKQALSEMKGSITVADAGPRGACFEIRVSA
ncbi:ATP-binding protein [Xanthomonas axonopodis]|uniref:ATP-binding protein n=1 Tax=Xanthomonas axonopodis TaxID=53413 RepID=UPI00355890FA